MRKGRMEAFYIVQRSELFLLLKSDGLIECALVNVSSMQYSPFVVYSLHRMLRLQ